MLTPEDFAKLTRNPESETLDFKQKCYDLSDKRSKFSFIKDLLCFANTPREDSSFVLFGVADDDDGARRIVGIEHSLDDASFQDIARTWIHPSPRFLYYELQVQSKLCGVLEVFPERLGPFVPNRDLDNLLRRGQICFRQGSRNTIANEASQFTRITDWIRGTSAVSFLSDNSIPVWERFKFAVHNFSQPYRFILVSSPIRDVPPLNMRYLGLVPWSLVVDFDSESDTQGLLSGAMQELEKNFNVHLLVKGDRPVVRASRAVYWYFAKGLVGRQESVMDDGGDNWKTWQATYGRENSTQIQRVSSVLLPSNVICVVWWETPALMQHLNSIVTEMLTAFGSSVEFVFASPEDLMDGGALRHLEDKFDGTFVSMPFHQMASGIKDILSVTTDLSDPQRVVLPSNCGAPVEIEDADLVWLMEDLDLIHRNIGDVRPLRESGGDICRRFLQGNAIDWYELALRCDVERDVSPRLLRQLRRDLRSWRTLRVNLYHSPGAGGTTIARRVLWELREESPCVLLSRYVTNETVERIYKIVSLTNLPPLIVCEGASLHEGEIDEFFLELRARNIAAVVLQVLRRFRVQTQAERSFFLPQILSLPETSRFTDIYSNIAPSKRSELERLARSNDEIKRSAFYFGLQVFGRDFRSLDRYVRARLEPLPLPSRRICTILAFVYYYSQHGVPAELFAHDAGVGRGQQVRLERILPDAALELVASEENGSWRAIHIIVAEEILQQTLVASGADRRSWKQSLTTLACDFLDIIDSAGFSTANIIVDIAKRIFIYRDNIDLIGSERAATTRFSQFIEDVPSREGRLNVLLKIVEIFPEDAHVWAHLGRYYSKEMRDWEGALQAINRAITLDPEDHSLHHMRGMVYREQAEEASRSRAPLEEVVILAKSASECFSVARSLAPDSEHGYVSEVQMIAAVLKYVGLTKGDILQYVMREDADPYLREALGHAEELLEVIRRSREGQGASGFEIDCRARLDMVYGKHERALQTWHNLLSRQDVYKTPMRRQIVWTHLARSNRTWSNLSKKEVVKCVKLLEDNLAEDRGSDKDIRLWLQAVRHYPNPPTMEQVIERIAYWRSSSGSLESVYYLYVLHEILALEGSQVHLEEAAFCLEECRALARRHRNRTNSLEWLGVGSGISGLVHHSELGDWDKESNFWQNRKNLRRVGGRIAVIRGPQAGNIEACGGVTAFFVPAKGDFHRGDAENERVEFVLGFSYDGPRAWNVQRCSSEERSAST